MHGVSREELFLYSEVKKDNEIATSCIRLEINNKKKPKKQKQKQKLDLERTKKCCAL